MIKSVVILVALAATAHATPEVKRKQVPTADKFAKAAAEAFGSALTADEKGDLPTALAFYQKAQAIAPHPNTAYNIADIQRRMGKLEDAIAGFETYMAMLPNAPDRADCEAIIDGLAHTPSTLYITTVDTTNPEALTFKDFYFLVDGEIKLKVGSQPTPQKEIGSQMGFKLTVLPGQHAVDAVSAISYGHADCEVHPGRYDICRISAKPRIDGRVVFRSGDHDVRVTLSEPHEREKSQYAERVELPPGKRKLTVRDRNYECPAIVADIPTGTQDIAYIFTTSNEYDGFERCRKIVTKQLKLHFD